MARPQRNNVDYFPFDCSEGKKMYYLEETYGNDGFAVFMKLLRELARTDYHYLDLSKKTTLMFLSAKCKVSTNTLEAIINDLVELEKFDVQLWSENKIIWCQDFIDSIQDAYSKRLNDCINKNGLLELLTSLGIRKPPKSNPKPPKQPSEGGINPQSKVEYSKEEDTIVDIISHLNIKTSKSFKPTTAKTKALISARLKEGFTIDDFKKVIDTKSKQWLNDSSFEQYLRPETLFGNKFEGYLNEGLSNSGKKNKNYGTTNQQTGISKQEDAAIGLAKRVAQRHFEETGDRISYEQFLNSGN